jgi:hypothetical protein
MKLTPDDLAYLRQAAERDHYNADDALKVFSYESSNRPDVWGGKGGKYFGIFQAGPSERAQFGIDTKNPNARNQIDAFGKFLSARGYKPGMSLMDMYSTVNAGSPGHYNASDGNGTVASHVARMSGSNPLSYAAMPQNEAPKNITELIGLLDHKRSSPQPAPVASTLEPSGLIGIRKAAMNIADEAMDENDDQEMQPFKQAMLDFHKRNHAQALGLLGGE